MISNNESNIQSTTRHKNWDHILTLTGIVIAGFSIFVTIFVAVMLGSVLFDLKEKFDEKIVGVDKKEKK
uniref:Uncharacterized protein n=1 Tax=Candidatus Kentrum sp. UNK TaxID=2126344 RepID=A0A451A1S4_9GAMM|nr:MAG: hypothetical protein BECKUNK1418G_GA0071005_100968 [Candidatus Kentron sp. UNK]VFK72325.1 MAG: hypothetical protein BECKUNK1418H_GA0071006_11084 [Candidatus Kentron sp. UNK]